jgi:predicted nuclease with RNAse H fold
MDHALCRVTSFAIVSPFVLDVRFDDGTRQRIDFQPVLHGELYGALRDAMMFERVAIDPDAHTLVWPNGADFDPATLHDWPNAGPRMIELAQRWTAQKRHRRTQRHVARARTRIIGVDYSTDDCKVGVALAASDDDGLRLQDVTIGGRGRSPRSIVQEWLTDSEDAVLIAIDAPLGWPRPLSTSLESHSAGSAIDTPADDMFRRATDMFIKDKIKTPLDVGADKIARTAHAALRLLGELRDALGVAIPLAWNPADVTDHAVIEVYPASTLIAHGIPPSGHKPSRFSLPSYKKKEKVQQRREIVEALRKRMTIPERDAENLWSNDDMLDAAVCALAAQDFITGRAAAPPDRCRAEREGWIWTALPPDAIYTAPHE